MSAVVWKIINLALAGGVFFFSLRSFAAAAVFAAAAALADFFYIRPQADRKEYLRLALPVIFLLGLFVVSAAISATSIRALVGLAGALLFYFFQINFRRPPFLLEQTFTLAAGFLTAGSVGALNFFFTPAWGVTGALNSAVFFFLFWQAFRKSIVWTLILTLILSEISWAVLFLPFHFLTSAVAVFAAFYLLYLLSWLKFEGMLAKKRVYFHLGIAAGLLVISFLSSAWQPH